MSFKRSNRSRLINLYLPLQLIGFLVFMALCAVRMPESAAGSTAQDSGSRPGGIYDQSAPGNGNNQDAEFSPQSTIAPFTTFFDTDFTSSGFGGMRGVGTGTITIAGVSGSVTSALLFWHGPTNSTDPNANANVLFNGTAISGGNIGFSADNGWGFQNSQAYMADVTSLVSGNGSYTLANFRNATSEINGASLIVFFTDGNSANDRDVVLFIGNDSNQANQFDSAGWNVTLAGINYTSGNANLQLHVSDGQTAPDDAILLNGNTLVATGPIFSGGTTDHGSGCCGDPGLAPTSGYLWDIRTFDITSFLSPGQNTISMTSGLFGDFLSLIVAAIDLPAGAAPLPCALTCPPDVRTTNDPGECGATVNYDVPDVPSNCGVVTCDPPPGFFPVGVNTVRCTLTTNSDGSPVTVNCSFTVTVVDNEPPRFDCPLETRVDCPGSVDYELPDVTDNCPNLIVTCTPPPGASFPVGRTVVNCSATDQGGTTARCSFQVVVADSTAPIITSCPTAPIALPNPTGACTVALGNVTGGVDGTDG
ncbi:MAG TPA: HYR domain-containing protein, partial [Blastocatellia bacterium]